MEAIQNRHAVRRYLDRAIPEEVRSVLNEEIERYNEASGLAFHACYDEPTGFRGAMAKYGGFSGVHNYFALCSPESGGDEVAVGYFGQKLVLLAQHLGLNTCWVGLTYNKKNLKAQLDDDEDLTIVVSVGYGENQGKPHKSKPLEKLGRVEGDGPMPDWFIQGLEAAVLAPTAVHQQKFSFVLDGDTVHAYPGSGSYVQIDLGIAKLHFEIGANSDQWHWA